MSYDLSHNILFKHVLQLYSLSQEPPRWVLKPSNLRGTELERVEFKCSALGSPPPTYTWVDEDGIDATEKEGELTTHLFSSCRQQNPLKYDLIKTCFLRSIFQAGSLMSPPAP